MKKHIHYFIAGLLVLLFAHTSKAQVEFSGGLLGGVTFGNVDIDDGGAGLNGSIKGDNIYGFEGGLYAKLKVGPFYGRPELLYDYRRGQVNYSDNNGSQSEDFSVHKIEVPVLIGLHIIGPLNIEAGPVYNYLMTVTEDYNSNNVSLGRNGIGWRAGAVLEIESLLLSLHYQGATYSTGSNSASFSEPYKIVLGIGIRLGSTGD